jgi:hypothetical protein
MIPRRGIAAVGDDHAMRLCHDGLHWCAYFCFLPRGSDELYLACERMRNSITRFVGQTPGKPRLFWNNHMFGSVARGKEAGASALPAFAGPGALSGQRPASHGAVSMSKYRLPPGEEK